MTHVNRERGVGGRGLGFIFLDELNFRRELGDPQPRTHLDALDHGALFADEVADQGVGTHDDLLVEAFPGEGDGRGGRGLREVRMSRG